MNQLSKTIPSDACQLRAIGGATSVDEDTFTLTPYKKGQRVEHPFWGAFVFETSTIRMGKKKIPVTVDHKTSMGCGYASDMEIGEFVQFKGTFVDNEHARYVKSYKGADVMETSLRFDPMVTEMVFLDDGESEVIDGISHDGPLHIFKNASLIECAFTLIGAIPDTATNFGKSTSIVEKPMADVPSKADIQASVHAELQASFTKMNSMCDDKDFVTTCFSKGMSIEDFSADLIVKLKEENVQFKSQIETLKTDLAARPEKVEEGAEGVSFSAGASESQAEVEPTDAAGWVAKFSKEGSTEGEAWLRIAREKPEVYSQFRKSLV